MLGPRPKPREQIFVVEAAPLLELMEIVDRQLEAGREKELFKSWIENLKRERDCEKQLAR